MLLNKSFLSVDHFSLYRKCLFHLFTCVRRYLKTPDLNAHTETFQNLNILSGATLTILKSKYYIPHVVKFIVTPMQSFLPS